MRKLYVLISLIIVLFLIFIYVLITPKNYILSYNLDKVKITEEYQKDNNGYFYTLNYNEQDYPLFISKKYNRKRKHITKVKVYEEDKDTCLVANIKNNNYTICSNESGLIGTDLASKKMKENLKITSIDPQTLDTYQNINIYTKNNKFIIWNYKGFYQLNSKYKTLEKLFNKDTYQNSLSYQTDQYLIFPDYNSEYIFTKFYVYDTKKNTLSTVTSDFDISYDSFFLGYYKNKFYLVDKKNKFEYEINIKKSKVNIISKDNTCKLLIDEVWKNESLTKVINQELKFTNKTMYKYYLENNSLYLEINKYRIKITNLKVNNIVKTDNSTVYFLSDDKLYSYNYLGQEKLLLKYSEWNFNYSNHIFIFD